MAVWVAARRVARRPAAKEGNSQEGSSCEQQRQEQQAKSIGCKGRQRGRGGSGNKGDAEGDANWSEQQLNSFQVAAHTRRLPCAHVCTFADEDVRGLGLSDIGQSSVETFQ